MFRPVRRQEREVSPAEAEAILVNGTYGVLSVGSDDQGYAYGIPLSYAYADGHIYFHCALEGQKLECIRRNNKVSFCVVGRAIPLPEAFSMDYTSAIVHGEVTEVEEAEKRAVLTALIEKYSPDYAEPGAQYIERAQHKTIALKLRIEHIAGKSRKS